MNRPADPSLEEDDCCDGREFPRSILHGLIESLQMAKKINNGCVLSKFDVIELLGYIDALKEDAALSGLFQPGEITPPDGGPMQTRQEELPGQLAAQETISEIQQLAIADNKIRMEEANSLLRSAYQVALREGKETNWEAFKKCVYKELVIEHKIMYPSSDDTHLDVEISTDVNKE